MSNIPSQTGEKNAGNGKFPLWKKSVLALMSFLVTFAALEIASRLYVPTHAPVLLRDGIYVNALPLVTGLVASNFIEKPKGERIPMDKPEGEIRVFVFGESSIQGLPLDAHASAPTMLHDLLKEAAPELNIKVINMGRTSSISANVFYYLLAARLYDPDFIIS
ncbi:MAG: hypothetical protein FJ088_03820, partial [Deltaproteobacteria bacterium]|nr:hypothetical protein [Deltaproteobacteria bacterium]